MTDVVVPLARAEVPEARVRTSRVVSAEEWAGAASVAAWVQGSGGVALPSHHVGLEIPTGSPITILDTSLTDLAYGWWREATMALALLVTAHRESLAGGYSASITIEAGDGTTVWGSWTIRLDNTIPQTPRHFELEEFALAMRGGEMRLLVTAIASTTELVVDLVQAFELPRSRLKLDAADYAVLPASCGATSPIYDVQHLSVRGAVDAHLYADWRRQGYFHQGSRDNAIVVTADGTVQLFPFGLPMQSQIEAPGDTTQELLVVIEAYFDDDGDGANTGDIKITTDVGGASVSQSITSAAWATYLFRTTVATEDLDSADGRRSSSWELMHIGATLSKNSGAPSLHIGTIGVFSANAQGELGFSGANYYAQSSAAELAGSDTMTRSIVFRVDASSASARALMEFLIAGAGWSIKLLSSGALEWRVRNGGGDSTITSAALTVGETYVATMSWDGADLRLVVGQVAATPVAGGFTAPASGAAGLGADAVGSEPSADITILGATASDAIALSDAAMQAHNALCAAVADVRPFAGCEHVYSARFGLHVDLIGDAHWTINGSTSLERFAPKIT